MLSLCMQFSKYSPVTFQILESAGSEQTGSRISGRNIRMILPVSYYIVLCKRNQVLFTNLTKKTGMKRKAPAPVLLSPETALRFRPEFTVFVPRKHTAPVHGQFTYCNQLITAFCQRRNQNRRRICRRRINIMHQNDISICHLA